MRTSKLLCAILMNEGEIEVSQITNYVKQLVQLGYLETNVTKVKLSDKGRKYISNYIPINK